MSNVILYKGIRIRSTGEESSTDGNRRQRRQKDRLGGTCESNLSSLGKALQKVLLKEEYLAISAQ